MAVIFCTLTNFEMYSLQHCMSRRPTSVTHKDYLKQVKLKKKIRLYNYASTVLSVYNCRDVLHASCGPATCLRLRMYSLENTTSIILIINDFSYEYDKVNSKLG